MSATKRIQEERTEELFKELNKDGFMTAGTGAYWDKRKCVGPLRQSEMLKFDAILLKWASADPATSIRNYLASEVTVPKGEGQSTEKDFERWTNDLIDCFCGTKSSSPAGLGVWHSYHVFFGVIPANEPVHSIYEVVRNAFKSPVQETYIRQFIDYAQQLDEHLLRARSHLKRIFDFYIARNQIDHPTENILYFSSLCVQHILSARLIEDHIGHCIENAMREQNRKETITELTELKEKMPELNQIIAHIAKIDKQFSARATVKKISQEETAAQVRRSAKNISTLKRYQHCTRETICHWENGRTRKPEWYDRSIRSLGQIEASRFIMEQMQRELGARAERKSLMNPRRLG